MYELSSTAASLVDDANWHSTIRPKASLAASQEREREQAPTHVSHRLRQRATLPCVAHVMSRCDALQATEQPEQRSERTRYRIGFEVVGAAASVDQHVLHHLLWLGFLQETERARVRGTMARMARGDASESESESQSESYTRRPTER